MNTIGHTGDVVNHPSHYTQYTGFEVIDVCEQLRAPDGSGNFNRGNAFKYLARAGWKNPAKEIEDLKKAVFYLQREIDRLDKPQPGDPRPVYKAGSGYWPQCPSCGQWMQKDPNEKNLFICALHLHPLIHDVGDDPEIPGCPECHEPMIKDPKDRNTYYCENGHPRGEVLV